MGSKVDFFGLFVDTLFWIFLYFINYVFLIVMCWLGFILYKILGAKSLFHLKVLCWLGFLYTYVSVVGVEICNTQLGSYSSSNSFSQTGRPSYFLGFGQFWGI